jgi:hypothetical protein
MYRIELSSKEEIVLRTIEELAVAIRRNVVTSRARIWHNSTNKWLPIQFHPHYKIAASMPLTQADLVAGPRMTPLSSLNLSEALADPPAPVLSSRDAATQAALAAWPAPKPVSTPPAKPVPPAKPTSPPPTRKPLALEAQITLGTPAPEPRRMVQPARIEPPRAAPPRVVEPLRPAPARAKSSRKRRKPARSLHLALAGAVLAACAQLVISAASNPRSEITVRIRTPQRLIEVIEAMKEDSPRTVAGVLPALHTIPLPRKPTPSITGAPLPPPAALKPTAIVPQRQAAIPGVTADSTSTAIQPAPAAGHMPVGVPAAPVAGTSKMVDSTGKKVLDQILRTLGGTPAPASKTPKPAPDR